MPQPTPEEYATAALAAAGVPLTSAEYARLKPHVVGVIESAILDETRACAELAEAVAGHYRAPGIGADVVRFEVAAGLAARIRHRVKRWPDEGATR